MTPQVPPGIARSFERDAVNDDLPPELPPERPPSALSEWAEKNLTVQNFLILMLLLFQAGGWWKEQQNNTADLARSVSSFEIRLQAAETATRLATDTAGSIYVRRDVLDVTLKSMDERLKNIETWMRNNGK